MKCVQKLDTGKITRVSDEQASLFVKQSTHKYVPKHEWKRVTRS